MRPLVALALAAALAACSGRTLPVKRHADDDPTHDADADATGGDGGDGGATDGLPTDNDGDGDPDPCANCNDQNPCTIDACVTASCGHTPVTSGATGCASDWSIERCQGGTGQVTTCARLCEQNGDNATTGCDPVDVSCGCSTLYGTCGAGTVGVETCASNASDDYIAICRAAADFATTAPHWTLYGCSRMCREAGFSQSGGCAISPDNPAQRVCMCGAGCPPCGAGSVCNALTGACAPDTGCTSDSQCGYSQACFAGVCETVECTLDSQCAYCYRCQNHTCVYCGEGPYGCYCY